MGTPCELMGGTLPASGRNCFAGYLRLDIPTSYKVEGLRIFYSQEQGHEGLVRPSPVSPS